MPSTTLPALTDDELDDILYFSRTGGLTELKTAIETSAKQSHVSSHDILLAAVDQDSGNSALHMASANGHTGASYLAPHNHASHLSMTDRNPRDPNIHPIPGASPSSNDSPLPPKLLRQHTAPLGVSKRASRSCQTAGPSWCGSGGDE